MKDYRRTRRVGICAILFALVLRLWAAKVPETLFSQVLQPNIAAFLQRSETGRNVRFSSSSEVFMPDFVESPPPLIPEHTEEPLPSFSGEENVELYDAALVDPDIPSLLTQPLQWDLVGKEPTVLILHTHATEIYTQVGEHYVETSAWRTLEEDYNMLSIGKKVGEVLARHGITAIQDRELHDYPSYNGSYVHARKSIKAYLEEYPTIRLVLDLHRDASGGDGGQMRTRATVDGRDSAQLMVVLGTNHKGYEENLAFGVKLHAWLEEKHPGIMRPLQLRTARYNQDLHPNALLIEVGAAGNTHPEAMVAAEALGNAIAALSQGTA